MAWGQTVNDDQARAGAGESMPLLKREPGRSRVLADGTGAESDPAVSEVSEDPQVADEPTAVSEVSEGPQVSEEEPVAAVSEVSEGPQVSEEEPVAAVSEVSEGPQFPEEEPVAAVNEVSEGPQVSEGEPATVVSDVSEGPQVSEGEPATVVSEVSEGPQFPEEEPAAAVNEVSDGPQFPEELRELAERNAGGWVYDVDANMRDDGVVPPRHVLGAWRIDADGSPSGEYVANPYFGPFTPRRRFRRWWMVAAAVVVLLVIAGVAVILVRHSTGTNHKPTSSVTGAQPVQLAIAAKSRVWVCLQDARGHVLVNGHVLQPGQVVHPVRSPVFHVYLGNSGVALRVNGKAQSLAVSSKPIGYTITQHQLSRLPAAAKPPCP